MTMSEKYIAVLTALLEERKAKVMHRIDEEHKLHKDCDATYLNGYNDALTMVLSLIK